MKISKRHHFWRFYKICLPVLLSHVILDLLTSYGTMIFSPFWDNRFAWDLIFIIDLVFSGIIFIPLLVSTFWKEKAQWICRGSLMGLTLYILFCWVQHHRAIEVAKVFAKNLNEEVIQEAALPQPVSPFRWASYVETKDKVYQGFVNLLMEGPASPALKKTEPRSNFSSFLGRLKGLYQPPGKVIYQSYPKLQNSPWVDKALITDGVKFFYRFAKFPVVKSVNSRNGRHRIEFEDLRFLVPGVRMPFIYYVEFDDAGKIQTEGWVGDRERR